LRGRRRREKTGGSLKGGGGKGCERCTHVGLLRRRSKFMERSFIGWGEWKWCCWEGSKGVTKNAKKDSKLEVGKKQQGDAEEGPKVHLFGF